MLKDASPVHFQQPSIPVDRLAPGQIERRPRLSARRGVMAQDAVEVERRDAGHEAVRDHVFSPFEATAMPHHGPVTSS